MNPPGRWAVQPLAPDASQAVKRQHSADEASLRHEVRWRWNEVCSGNHLTHRIVPTGVASREPPRIGRISLGPPTTFSVNLRPGQLLADFSAISVRLASAFEVDDVLIENLAPGWLRIVLVERRRAAVRDASPNGPPDSSHAAVTKPRPPIREGPHLGRRGRRRPFGGPRR